MIRFEKGDVVKYFANGMEAAEWMEEEWENLGEFQDLLEDEAETFGYWLNDNFTAFDILTDRTLTYDDLHTEWIEGLAHDIEHNYIAYFHNEGEVDTAHLNMDSADALADALAEMQELLR